MSPSPRSDVARASILPSLCAVPILLVLFSPAALPAQGCLRLPNAEGEASAAATFQVDRTGGEGADGDTASAGGTSFGLGGVRGEAAYNAPGPVSLTGEYAVLDVDSLSLEKDRIGGLAAVQLGGGTASVCAVGGLAREGLDGALEAGGTLDHTAWEVPLGVGVSRSIQPTGSIAVAPFLFPHAVYRDVSSRRVVGDSTVTSSDTEYSGRATGGVVVSGSTFWGRLSAGVDVPVGESAELMPLAALTFGLLF